jgi:hypothetical protein
MDMSREPSLPIDSASLPFAHEASAQWRNISVSATQREETGIMSTVPPHIRSIINHDGAVLLDIPRDQMVTLNSTGAYIWEMLQQGRTIDEVIHELSTESKTDPVVVERDVHAFLEQLMSKHLLYR